MIGLMVLLVWEVSCNSDVWVSGRFALFSWSSWHILWNQSCTCFACSGGNILEGLVHDKHCCEEWV